MCFRTLAAGCCAVLVLGTGAAMAQMAVLDAANLGVARQNAENTRDIMNTSQQILDQNKKILEALSGDRSSDAQGNMASAALGGNSVSSAPPWGSILNGSALSFGGLSGGAQNLASTLINGLQLVKSVSRAFNDGSGKDVAYRQRVQRSHEHGRPPDGAHVSSEPGRSEPILQLPVDRIASRVGQGCKGQHRPEHADAGPNRADHQRVGGRLKRCGRSPQHGERTAADTPVADDEVL